MAFASSELFSFLLLITMIGLLSCLCPGENKTREEEDEEHEDEEEGEVQKSSGALLGGVPHSSCSLLKIFQIRMRGLGLSAWDPTCQNILILSLRHCYLNSTMVVHRDFGSGWFPTLHSFLKPGPFDLKSFQCPWWWAFRVR